MSAIVQRFEPNPRGRDFVVGDIHGCFAALRRALEGARFDACCDRLFSVGDLIDRGPCSAEALDWLNKPWFHACIGNHEDMALQSQLDDHVLGGWLLFNGGEWWLSQDSEARSRYLEAFRKMPVAMQVDTARGHLGIVHADIPLESGWQDFVQALERGDSEARRAAIWSRRRAEGCIARPVEGIDAVVCGHTITADFRVHRLANVWFIDTGAFLSASGGGRLTLLTLNSVLEDSGPHRAQCQAMHS